MNALILTVTSLLCAADAKPQAAPLRVLIVTGVDHPAHNWKKSAPAVKRILEKDARLAATIVEDPNVLGTDAVFAYDVILLHFRNERPLAREEQARVNLAKFVKEGKGLVVLHFACGAFGDWPEFEQLAGRVWDRKNTHDPRGPFTVQLTDPEHPITRGMTDFQADDELYFCLTGEPNVHVLAEAKSKVVGKNFPMAFCLHYGRGRVFHTPLGHDVKALEMPGVAELLRRGTLWTRDALPAAPAK